jgi:hypothetical protein
VRHRSTSRAGARWALAGIIGLTVLGAGACGGSDPAAPSGGPARAPAATAASASAAAQPAASASASGTPAPRCRKVPRTTLRLIASHANARTRFASGTAAAVHAGPGYAVSMATLAGGTRRVATWFVDDLRTPQTVTSANTQALQITNWPLESLDASLAGQSRNCVTQNERGVGPVP